MSSSDLRRDVAGIARGIRRSLERDDARGLGELLARDAGKVPATAGRKVPATAGDPAKTARAMNAERAKEAAANAPAPASAASVDLFGRPTAGPAPAATPVETRVEVVPAAPMELHPRGWAEREGILLGSLPVLQTVAAEIAACRMCGLCETRANTVPGVGSARSGIVFVGEAPGADEDAQGEPFVGRAGQLLTRIIQAMDDAKLIPGMTLSRETVYICNVLKCRPPENRNPLPHEIERCSPYLERQLAVIRPRVICCLGKFAAELLLGVKGTIASLRGRVYSWRGSKMIVTYHPAACLRNPGYKRPVWEDMQLVAREYLTD